jgi:type VI secretion system protein ImpL
MEFDIKAESPGALRFVLGQIASPSSPLTEIMLTMKDNTQIDGLDKNEFMRALAVNLAEFDFVKRLMGEQAGKFPEFDKYKAILEQMQMDIQDQKEPAPKKDEQAAMLMKRLSPLGRASFAIFNSEKDSYLNLVKQWLDSVGVPPQWQNVFLAPVWQAYFLGMAEIETEIDKIWTELCQNDIQPLYTKFPFRFSSSEDISMEEIKNATHPSGHFWQAYQGMLKPFCVEESQNWHEIKGPFNVPRLPSDMRAKLNAFSKISSILWDNNGKERPLEIMIRPGILPSVLPEEPIPTLSYLNVGESSVFGFNQKPNWKKLVYSWQNSCPASAGIEFTTKNQPGKIRKTIEIPASYWSFFHLLKKTREYSKDTSYTDAGTDNSKKTEVTQTVTWVVNSPATTDIEIKDTADSVTIPEEIKREEIRFGSDTEKKIRYIESRPVEVVFTIQGNPWEVFKIPR